jgi:hypothetical protein
MGSPEDSDAMTESERAQVMGPPPFIGLLILLIIATVVYLYISGGVV